MTCSPGLYALLVAAAGMGLAKSTVETYRFYVPSLPGPASGGGSALFYDSVFVDEECTGTVYMQVEIFGHERERPSFVLPTFHAM